MAKVLEYDGEVVSEFELLLRHNVHFRTDSLGKVLIANLQQRD